MRLKRVLIVSDADNLSYWRALTEETKTQFESLKILLDREIDRRTLRNPYDVILMDVANGKTLQRLIPTIHSQQPDSRIIILTSSPTWKQMREVIQLGADRIARKSPNLEELVNEPQSF